MALRGFRQPRDAAWKAPAVCSDGNVVFCCVTHQPLPDTQYNGNPESVGYRIRVWRVEPPAPALLKVIGDRLARECTVEELQEWTEYELQIQAFNAIGAGPWSEAVRGRTRESGESKHHICWHRKPKKFTAFCPFVQVLIFWFGVWMLGGVFLLAEPLNLK